MPIDWQKLLELAPLALMKPGSREGADMLRGFLESRQAWEAQQQRERGLQGQEELRRAQMENLYADNARADAQLQLNRGKAYLEDTQGRQAEYQQAPETAFPPQADPLQAQNQEVLQRLQAQMATGTAGLPQGPLPNMTALVSEGKKRRAKKRYAEFLAAHKDQAAEAEASMTDSTGEFAGLTFAAIREMAESVAPPPAKVRPPAQPGSFEEYIDAPPARQAVIEAGRKRYMQSDDRPQTGATVVIQTVDAQGNPVTKIVPKEAGTEFAARPASGGLGGAAVQLRNQRTAAALNSVERLKRLAPVRRKGPAGIGQGIVEVAKGYAGYSTKTRQFQALIQPTAMQMAAAIQGAANLSDNERRVMAEMLGSISRMDYESQMALLDQAFDLLKSNADVEQRGSRWYPAGSRVKGPASESSGGAGQFEILSVK